MTKSALFILHKAKPGKRDAVLKVWERYARDYVAGLDGQLAYFYCLDDNDPDSIVVFQLAADSEVANDFVKQPWFAAYEQETNDLLSAPSEYRTATPHWQKRAGLD